MIKDSKLPLVSIIIPIYNVEDYLRRCVESVTMQSFNNLEILLIDDGSDDNSGKICDELALRDGRILVIHKENGGLSDARNAGLDVANGDYIMFVDSDDYIHKNMVEILLDCFDDDVDLAICKDRAVYDDYGELEPSSEYIESVKSKVKYISPEMVVNDSLVSACEKMYKKGTWDTLRFPVGRYHEDEFALHKIVYGMNRIAFVPEELYYYRQRNNSIVHTLNSKRMWDTYDAYYDRLCFALDKKWDAVLEKTVYWISHYVMKFYFENSGDISISDKQELYRRWKGTLADNKIKLGDRGQLAFYKSPEAYLRYCKKMRKKNYIVTTLVELKHRLEGKK